MGLQVTGLTPPSIDVLTPVYQGLRKDVFCQRHRIRTGELFRCNSLRCTDVRLVERRCCTHRCFQLSESKKRKCHAQNLGCGWPTEISFDVGEILQWRRCDSVSSQITLSNSAFWLITAHRFVVDSADVNITPTP